MGRLNHLDFSGIGTPNHNMYFINSKAYIFFNNVRLLLRVSVLAALMSVYPA